jgi:hypothetical protein
MPGPVIVRPLDFKQFGIVPEKGSLVRAPQSFTSLSRDGGRPLKFSVKPTGFQSQFFSKKRLLQIQIADHLDPPQTDIRTRFEISSPAAPGQPGWFDAARTIALPIQRSFLLLHQRDQMKDDTEGLLGRLPLPTELLSPAMRRFLDTARKTTPFWTLVIASNNTLYLQDTRADFLLAMTGASGKEIQGIIFMSRTYTQPGNARVGLSGARPSKR